MLLNVLAAAFALLVVLRHGRRALKVLAPGTEAQARWRALPSFFTAAVAVVLLLASLALIARRPT